MEITFLGTNGWYSKNSNTICTLIESNSYYIILDAGDGLSKLDKFIKSDKPIILFLTHTHLDHIIGLHALSKFRFKQGIKIYSYKGTKNALESIIKHPFTTPLSNLPYKVEIFEFDEGEHSNLVKFTCKLLVHSDDCLGYRIIVDDKIITYCTDTGACENIYLLSKNSDLLISECSYKPGQEKWGWPHLKPEEIANIAKDSNVKFLILTHFDASIFKNKVDREKAITIANEIFPNTIGAYDGFEFSL